MKVGIMQPYFLPYMGYFQLIHAVDVYVNLDHVSFMKRSYMTRNHLKNQCSFGIQVTEGSQNRSCREVGVNYERNYVLKTRKTLENLYSKSPYYQECIELLDPLFQEEQVSVSELNLELIRRVCQRLGITTQILSSSVELCAPDAKREYGLVSIAKNLNATVYINAIGGTKLYSKEFFKDQGIELKFVQTQELDLKEPNLSVLHQLMNYSPEHLQEQLLKYQLI